MARWLEIRSQRRGEGRLAFTRDSLKAVAKGVLMTGALGVLVTTGIGWLVSPEPLRIQEWLYAIALGFGCGAGLGAFFGAPIVFLGLASDAGEAISVAVEDHRVRLTHKADPARGLLSEVDDERIGQLSQVDAHGLSLPSDEDGESDEAPREE